MSRLSSIFLAAGALHRYAQIRHDPHKPDADGAVLKLFGIGTPALAFAAYAHGRPIPIVGGGTAVLAGVLAASSYFFIGRQLGVLATGALR